MINKIIIYSVLIFFSSSVYALHDSYLFMGYTGADLCLCADNVSNCVGTNEGLQLDGTDDHFIYIAPCIQVTSDNTTAEKLSYFVNQPYNMISGGFLFIIALLFGVSLVYVIYKFVY